MKVSRLAQTLLALQILLSFSSNAQAASQFAELEHRLLQSNALSLEFHVTASGAITVDLRGKLERERGGEIRLSAKGNFAGQEVDLIAASTRDAFEFGRRAAPEAIETPPALWESLILGFTRMGVLHNIANLSAGLMPDHAQGGVDDWVQVEDVHYADDTFSFSILVEETPSGSATLSLNEAGYPLRRVQTVAFPGGEMRVIEAYSEIVLSDD